MYFSVIAPKSNQLRSAAYDLAQTPYAVHQWLWNFFPSAANQDRDFIFHRHERGQDVRFYVVSHRLPVALNDAWIVQSRHYEPQLEAGQMFSFELRANPVVTKKSEAGKSRRHDVVMNAKKQLLAEQGLSTQAKWADWKDKNMRPLLYEIVQERCTKWLSDVAVRNGFRIEMTQGETSCHQLQVNGYGQSNVGKRGQNVFLSVVDFSGALVVTDPVAFKTALFNGIGHAKAFGCGLLLVRRLE
ncbi:hypothetical protein AEM42_05785 [Betaproteobacteria bacterium UKL13-2]|nr:hypothetical protein AEM42_05785 [Betaproteobacteria bacterium UKL13-2]HCG52006.1 type I-E CRISPR-associated protein Cas6/Cse3/CasE [Betaproteobacteria bacterium]